MPNPFAKGWNYLKASLDHAIDENADPEVQIDQAMTGAREQHQRVTEQASRVIGNARQLEMTMSKQSAEHEKVQTQVRQALQAADAARARGDEAEATRMEAGAEQLASHLVALEQDLEHTRALHGQAVQAAEQAKRAVTESEQRTSETLAQRDRLSMQATQAKMQEQQADAVAALSGGAASGGGNSPTFAEIEAKIEGRYATALGRQELAEASGAGSVTQAQADVAKLQRETAGRARLDQIRQSMGGSAGGDKAVDGPAGGSAAGEIEGPAS